MAEGGLNSIEDFYAKHGLYECMGLEIADAESRLNFIYLFSDPDIEKYLLSFTPAMLLFVAGSWRENILLIEDYLVSGSDGFASNSPFSCCRRTGLQSFKTKSAIHPQKTY